MYGREISLRTGFCFKSVLYVKLTSRLKFQINLHYSKIIFEIKLMTAVIRIFSF